MLFFNFIFKLYIIVLVLSNIKMNPPQVYMCSPSWTCCWTVVLEKTLESPLNSKEIQPVHPKGNHLEYSLGGLMLKLKLQYFGHLTMFGKQLTHLEKTLMLGKIEGRRRRGRQRTIQWTDSVNMSLSKIREIVKDMEAWQSLWLQRVGYVWANDTT